MNRVQAVLVSLSLLCLACSQVGPEGKEGAAARLSVSAEPAGTRCPNGGQKVESAVGTGPVTTAYLCNGGNGEPGSAARVSVSDEPAGVHCPGGGKKLETSVGTGPVTTSYLCNGAEGAGVLVVTEPEGANCAAGGVKVTGADGNARYVCNGLNGTNGTSGPPGPAGSSGANGADGQDVTADALPPGDTTCPAGGVKLTGASSTTYVCNGASPTVTVEPEPAGAHCPGGGQKVTATSPAGTTTAYVCNGA
ncbi:MAG: hypothetical protein FJ086_08505, partial [Deltaproteobacteria bacterium]|nr:hypothetical protein [Deltaproteobacteria bacterium]